MLSDKQIKITRFIPQLTFGLIAAIELYIVNLLSDLQPWLSNWALKSQQLINLSVPSDNYYGPGGPILLIPFLWDGPLYFSANLFYMFLGAISYYSLCQRINSKNLKLCSYLFLFLNPYLFWLSHSSQDTVFEFALLMISIKLLLNNKIALFCLITFLLAETRSQYWLFLFLTIFLKILIDYKFKRKMRLTYALPLFFLLSISVFNIVNYGSPSITSYAGETVELGQSRYLYLAHPKFDADYLLGLADDPNTYRTSRAPQTFSPAEKNNYYFIQGIKSIFDYPQQSVLNIMQKVDSYVFSTQKLPSSPGYFKFIPESNSIKIVEERLSWSLVLGNLLYQIWRIIMILLFISSITVLLIQTNKFPGSFMRFHENWLLIPWVSTFIVILLFYVETRYKLVPETLLPLYSLLIFDKFLAYKSR